MKYTYPLLFLLFCIILSGCTTTKPTPKNDIKETRITEKKPQDSVKTPVATPNIPPEAMSALLEARTTALERATLEMKKLHEQQLALARDPFMLLSKSELRGSKDLVLTAVGDVSQPTKQWPRETNKLKTKAFAPTQYLLDSGDLVAMNLENPVSDLQPTAKKEFSFTSAPERLGWYLDVGFNLFSLSNNHIADAAQVGIDDTIKNLKFYTEKHKKKAWWAGAGASVPEAEAPSYVTLPNKDLKIAFFSTGFSRGKNVSKFWSKTLIPNIKKAKKTHDLVIVSVHAGKEYKHIPESDQKKRYHKWVDAGADIIIGHHPHVIRPIEVYKNSIIFHSLGNYVFASRTRRHKQHGARMYGLVVRVIVQNGKVTGAEATPTWVNNAHDWVLEDGSRLKNAQFVPKVLKGKFADKFFEDFSAWTNESGSTPFERVENVARYRVPATNPPPASASPYKNTTPKSDDDKGEIIEECKKIMKNNAPSLALVFNP